MKQFVFGFFVLILTMTPVVFAEDTSSSSATITTPVEINYTLPYPGLLPDNPLYFLKATRDRVVSWLIADPLKRSQFDLLQADKRLQMGVALVQESKTKTSLAISTISKGQNYFEEAIQNLDKARQKGESMSAQKNIMSTASEKHKQVLHMLDQEVSSDERSSVIALENRMERMSSSLQSLPTK